MRINPALADLRRDPAPQLRAQAALEAACEAWRLQPQIAALLRDLYEYGEGAPLASCRVLDSVVADLALAQELVGSLVAALAKALVEHPLGHVPFRHQYSQGLAVLQLATAGSAALSLLCYEEHSGAAVAETVCFASGERHELCLAGVAEARFFEILREEPSSAELDCEPRTITPGDCLAFVGPRHTKLVDRPHGRMVMLRASRSDATPAPAREYRIADGMLIHRASGDRAESRDELAAAVLGTMQRLDAAPVLADIARSACGDHLRWQVLCHALTIDTATGFTALTGIASDEADALAGPAGALRASLIERYPVLAEGIGRCPA